MDFITLWNEISNTARDDYYSLSEAEQMLFNIKSIADNSCEGGLKSYYLSFAGAYASDAAEQLYSLGLDLIAAVIENCNSLFPDGIPPENDAERTEIIDDFGSEYDYLFDDWTDTVLDNITDLESEIDSLYEKISVDRA